MNFEDQVVSMEDDSQFPWIEGTVDFINNTYVVRTAEGRRYCFNNERSHNPFRGLGSQAKTYMCLLNDENRHLLPEYYNTVVPPGRKFGWIVDAHGVLMDDNTTNDALVGPILRNGQRVRFRSPRIDELLTNQETGETVLFIVSNSLLVCGISVADGCEGFATTIQCI